MKKIMILGAGVYQVPLIKAAKAKNLYVIVVSIPGNYPGFVLADKVYYHNTIDYKKILEIAIQEEIDAIVTTGTDVAVVTIGYVCEKLKLPGLSEVAAKRATNKYLMKEAFFNNGVNTARYKKVDSLNAAVEAAQEIGYPVMLKIVDKSGSRGITKVYDQKSMEEAYIHANDFTCENYMLVEQFINGTEIGVDAFIQNGEIKMITPHDKLVYFSGRTGIPIGHKCPCHINDTLHKEVCRQTELAIKALGLNNCAVNLDIMLTLDGEVFVIEATGRCGATGIPEVISGFLGTNYYNAILENALGNPVNFTNVSNGKPTASYLLHSDTSGFMKSISYRYNSKKYENQEFTIPEKVSIRLDDRPGERIKKFTNGTQRLGQAVFSEDTEEALDARLKEFQQSLVIDCKTDNQETNGD